MSDANNQDKSDLIKAYRKRHARGPAVKVNPTGGRGIRDAEQDTAFVLKALQENLSTVQERL